jgi:outer membrane protein assembly factor BamB
MNATEFINYLDAQQLLEVTILDQLRQLVSRTDQEVSAESLVKLLVEQGHLTRFQGSRLLADVPENPEERESLDIKHVESLDGEIEVKPEKDVEPPQEVGEEIVDLTSLGDNEEEEIVDLEQAEALPASSLNNDPLLDSPPVPGQQLMDPVDPALTKAGPPNVMDKVAAGQAPQSLSDLQETSNPWDTKLIVLGIGSFGLLFVAAIFLYNSITSYPPMKMLGLAHEDYNAGSYTQSIAKYEKFLKKYPRHEEASLATVRIGMCKIHQLVKIPEKALEKCKEILPELQKEEKFYEARDELVSLLPRITERFVDNALKATDLETKEKFLELSAQALELVNTTSYIPASKRKNNRVLASQLERIAEKQISLTRHIERAVELGSTMAQMLKAAEDGNTRQAFSLRLQLLRDFPELENDPQLLETVLEISRQEQQLVVAGKLSFVTTTSDHDLPQEETVIVATREGAAISGASPDVVFVLAGGSVYGIEVGSGQVLWRRFVGFETTVHPQRTRDEPGADAVLVDGKRHELLRLNSRDGKLVWRLEVKSPFSEPLIVNDQVLINIRPLSSNDNSSLLRVDVETGKVLSQVLYPMTLSTVPAYDPEARQFYQLGDHSNLYTISEETGRCSDVLYVGHREKNVRVGAVAAVGYVLVCENVEEDRCIIRIYVADKKTGKLKVAQRPLALKGKVVVPPLQYDRRVLITTDLGEIRVLEVDPNVTPPVQELAGIAASFTDPVVQYPMVDRGRLWIAGKQFARYRIQAVLGELTLDWIDNDGDVFVAPIQRSEDIVIHVRQQQGATAVTVAGQPVDARRAAWQTRVGGTSSVSVDLQNNLVRVVTSQTGVFRFRTIPTGQSIHQVAADGLENAGAYSRAVDLGRGRVVMLGSPGLRTVMYAEPGTEDPARQVGLLGSRGEMVSAAGFADQLLATFDDGSVRLFELPSGSQQVSPFQPSLRPGQHVDWSAPVVHADPRQGFAVLRDRHQLFRVRVKDEPRPHLALHAQRDLASPAYPVLAALGDAVLAVHRSLGHDTLVAYSWDSLEELRRWELTGRIIWGPHRVDDRLLLLTDRGVVICHDENLDVAWESTIKSRHLAGRPVSHEGDFIFVSLAGSIWRMDGKTGDVVATLSIQEPVVGSPVVFSDRLWLPGADGTIHVVPVPQREGGQSS